jgi:hypothetical protein
MVPWFVPARTRGRRRQGAQDHQCDGAVLTDAARRQVRTSITRPPVAAGLRPPPVRPVHLGPEEEVAAEMSSHLPLVDTPGLERRQPRAMLTWWGNRVDPLFALWCLGVVSGTA